MEKTKFSLLTLAILFSTHISCMELATTETKQESPLLDLSPEIYVLINKFSRIPTISSLKRTCKKLNDDTHYHQTSREVIQSADIHRCTAGLSYFAQTHAQNIKNNTLENNLMQNNPMLEANFKHLLLNNPDERKKALRILCWSIEQIDKFSLQEMMNAHTTLVNIIQYQDFETIINNQTALRILISIDPNRTDNDKRTLLHWACKENNTQIVQLLIETPGIDVNISSHIGETPLHWACHYNEIETVQLLLNVPGIDYNREDINGITPFYSACANEYMEIMDLFLELMQKNIHLKKTLV